MTKESVLSDTIKWFRFPMTLAIIPVHANMARYGLIIHGEQYGMNYPDWYFYICVFFSEIMGSISVPLFFVISGYLFFYKTDFDGQVYKKKLKSRFKSLMIPYLLWNLIILLAMGMKLLPIFSFIFDNSSNVEFRFSLARLFNTFFYYDGTNGLLVYPDLGIPRETPIPINGPLWYVRDLMMMVLLSPIIYWLIKKTKFWLIITIGVVLYIFGRDFLPNFKYVSLILGYMFFFSWGAYYSINKQDLITQFRKFKYVAPLFIPLTLINLFTVDTEYNKYIFFPFVLTSTIFLIVTVSYLIENDKIHVSKLASCAFFLYAMHALIIVDIGKVLFVGLHLTDTPIVMLLLYFAIPIVTVCICLFTYFILKKYAPKVCSILSGGR